jgi:hypothetical protein
MTWSEHGVEWERPSSRSPRSPPRIAHPWDRAEYQRLWLQMGSRDWRTLAVVPGEEGMSTYDVANLIMVLGVHHGESIGLFDFRDIRMSRVLEVIDGASRQLNSGERLIFATRSIRENLATIPLARATDSSVLCVSIGSTSMGFVAETIAQIGKDRFIGSLVVHGPRDEAPAPPLTLWRRRLEARC